MSTTILPDEIEHMTLAELTVYLLAEGDDTDYGLMDDPDDDRPHPDGA